MEGGLETVVRLLAARLGMLVVGVVLMMMMRSLLLACCFRICWSLRSGVLMRRRRGFRCPVGIDFEEVEKVGWSRVGCRSRLLWWLCLPEVRRCG